MKKGLSLKTRKTLETLQTGGLVSKNIRIHGRRTSVRLEPGMWDALYEISTVEQCSVHEICSGVDSIKEDTTSFTAALRVFLMQYYKESN